MRKLSVCEICVKVAGNAENTDNTYLKYCCKKSVTNIHVILKNTICWFCEVSEIQKT